MVGFISLVLVFLVIPATEIGAFIVIGGEIGVFWTLFITILTAVTGTYLLRRQGFFILKKIRSEIEADRIPGNELVYGVMILFAGLLLLIPGFVTDSVGLLLFVPAIRILAWGIISRRINWSNVQFDRRSRSKSGEGVVDLEEEEWEMKAEGSANFRTGSNEDGSNKEIEQKTS